MGFVNAKLELPLNLTATEGVLSAAMQLKLVQTQAQIEQLLGAARIQAQGLIDEAKIKADVLLQQTRQAQTEMGQQAQHNAQTLLEKINGEWKKIVGAIEPTAVAVARLAFDRVCAGANLCDQVDAAARAALRELPEDPVRLFVSPKGRQALAMTHWNAVPVHEDEALKDAGVRLEGKYGACDADFDLARAEVTNVLDAWAERATALLRTNEPPLATVF
jgi:F0F1-type ATP synthase membrane subunit b/b'